MNKHVTNIGTSLTSCMAFVVAIWFFGKDSFNAKVNERLEVYMESETYKNSLEKDVDFQIRNFIDSATFQVKLQNYLAANQSDNVNVLKLFSDKMKVPEDEVAKTLGDMATKDHPRLINLLRAVNAEHPDYNVWQIIEE